MKWIEFLPVFIAFLVTAVCTGLLIPFLNRKMPSKQQPKEEPAEKFLEKTVFGRLKRFQKVLVLRQL